MPDVFVIVLFDTDEGYSTHHGRRACAVRELRARYPDFLWPDKPWWRNPPDNPRGVIARVFSKWGCRGQLSVEPHRDGTPWDQPPPPRWTAFNPRWDWREYAARQKPTESAT